MSLFRRATRRQAKARIGLMGPSGSGKTKQALIWGRELLKIAGGDLPMALIDTERDSAPLYADEFEFDHMNFGQPFTAIRLKEAIQAAREEGYRVLIIDSLSHFWEGTGGVLDTVDAAASRSHGNTFAGWREGTPMYRDMIEYLLTAPMHIIVTLRSEVETVLEEDERGRKTPVKKGMKARMRSGIEYELTVVSEIEAGTHNAQATKSRCPVIADILYRKDHIVEQASAFAAWLSQAAPEDTATSVVLPSDEAAAKAASAPAVVVQPAQQAAPPPMVPLDEACPNCGKTGACFHHPAGPGRYFCAASQPTTDGGHGCNTVFDETALATARAKAAGNITAPEAAAMADALREDGSMADVKPEDVVPEAPQAAAEPEPQPAEAAEAEPEAAEEPAPAPAEAPAEPATTPGPQASEPAEAPKKEFDDWAAREGMPPAPDGVVVPPPPDGVVVQFSPVTKDQKMALAKRLQALDVSQRLTKPEWENLLALGHEPATRVINGLISLPSELRPARKEMREFMALPYDEMVATLDVLASRARATA